LRGAAAAWKLDGKDGSREGAMDIQPFLRSDDVAHDGAELARRMVRDGYLFLPGLLPREAVLDVGRQLLDGAAAGGWLLPGHPVEAAVAAPGAACCDPEPAYLAVFRDLWANEDLHALKYRPELVSLFERLFGEKPLVHPMFVQRNIFPARGGFDFTTKAHQDRVHIGGGTSYAAWVPLDDCPVEKGGLTVAAGSHRRGVLDFRVGTGPGGMEIDRPEDCPWVGGDFRAGDVLVFVDTTVHMALPNRTDRLRQSFDARYQRASDPVSDLSLRTYADILSWEEVYAGWRSTRWQYEWRRHDPVVVPFDTSYYERRDAEAFAMAERGEARARDTLLRIVQRDRDAAKRERASRLAARLEARAAG